MILARLAVACVCILLAACTTLPTSGAAPSNRLERQLLVMIPSIPPHFRPDASYFPGYGAARIMQNGTARELARRNDLELVNGWPMPALELDCFVMEARAPEKLTSILQDLSRDKRVRWAQPMNLFHVLGHDDPLYPLQPSARLWHLDEVHMHATGRNVRVAQIDTGVELDHPDLRGRVELQRNFADTEIVAEAHGTAIAAIIAARADDGIGIAGIAPNASLHALRACEEHEGSASATCTSFAIAKAMQFALDDQAQIINLSLGGPPDRLLQALLDVAIARHVVIVTAVDPAARDGGFPASSPGVLAVAIDASAAAPSHVLIAPGRDIPTAVPGHGWSFVNGTSYAAAHISGAVALLMEHAPGLTAVQIRRALNPRSVANAISGTPAMADVCSALERTTHACVCGCALAKIYASPTTH